MKCHDPDLILSHFWVTFDDGYPWGMDGRSELLVDICIWWSGISTCTTASAVAPSIPRLASMFRGWVGWEEHELEGR